MVCSNFTPQNGVNVWISSANEIWSKWTKHFYYSNLFSAFILEDTRNYTPLTSRNYTPCNCRNNKSSISNSASVKRNSKISMRHFFKTIYMRPEKAYIRCSSMGFLLFCEILSILYGIALNERLFALLCKIFNEYAINVTFRLDSRRDASKILIAFHFLHFDAHCSFAKRKYNGRKRRGKWVRKNVLIKMNNLFTHKNKFRSHFTFYVFCVCLHSVVNWKLCKQLKFMRNLNINVMTCHFFPISFDSATDNFDK